MSKQFYICRINFKVGCHVKLTFSLIESILHPIILPCSLHPPLLRFSITAINIVANQVSLHQATGADHPNWIMPLPMPMGVLVVILYCQEKPLNWGGVVALHPTIPHLVLHLVVCPLLKWGATHLRDTHSPPSLNQQNYWANTLLAQFVLLRQKGLRFKGGRRLILFMTNIVMSLLMTTNMTMMKIIFQSPMLCIQYQPWKLRERCLLTQRQQNWLRSIAKSTWRGPSCLEF
jgi:hypothetical protein